MIFIFLAINFFQYCLLPCIGHNIFDIRPLDKSHTVTFGDKVLGIF